MELQHGDILICRRNSFLSKMIRKFTKSEWSHTAMVLEVWDRIYIIEMQSKGVELVSFENWIKKWNYTFTRFYSKNSFDKKELALKAMSIVGDKTKYDYFTFIFRIPYKLVTKKYKYKGEEIETKRLICSQLTGWIHNLPNWHKMTPKSQYNYLNKNWKLTIKNCN